MNRRQSEFCAKLSYLYHREGTEVRFWPLRRIEYSRRHKAFVVQLVLSLRCNTPLGHPEVFRMRDDEGICRQRIRAHIETAYNLYQLLP